MRCGILIPAMLLLLLLAPASAGARSGSFTSSGKAPMYWMAYEQCFVDDSPVDESRWRKRHHALSPCSEVARSEREFGDMFRISIVWTPAIGLGNVPMVMLSSLSLTVRNMPQCAILDFQMPE